MDVSKRVEPGGQELLEAVVSLTGLPQPWVESELNDIVETAGHSPGEVTLEQLRSAMLTYLQSMEADLMAEEAPPVVLK